jgi:hypothetical protein
LIQSDRPGDGFPISERAGVLRYYLRVSDDIVWADRPEDLRRYMPRPEDLPPGLDPPRPISDQPLQQFEPDRWNDEQIDAGDVGGVIAQEALPTRDPRARAVTP